MPLMPKWNEYRTYYEKQVKRSQGTNEKPLVDFDKKVLAGITANVKKIDAAVAARNLAAITKLEADFHKIVLDFRVSSQKRAGDLGKIDASRAGVAQHYVKVLGTQLQDLKEQIGGVRKSAQETAPQLATDLIPQTLFTELRSSAVTRDPNVIKFGGGKEFTVSLTDGRTPMPLAAALQKEFRAYYKRYLASLKQVDTLKTRRAHRDTIGTEFAAVMAELEETMNQMSFQIAQWQTEQAEAGGKAISTSAPYQLATAANETISRDSARLLKLREQARKLFPIQFR